MPPAAILFARFRRHYADPALWQNPRYPTRDRCIPVDLFWIYYRAMLANLALERVNQTQAIARALGMLFAKDGGLSDAMQADLKEAYLHVG